MSDCFAPWCGIDGKYANPGVCNRPGGHAYKAPTGRTDEAPSRTSRPEHDGKANKYDVALDPRCLWGWGPGDVAGCHCMFGHACFRPVGHPGKCWDGGDKPRPGDLPCEQRQRPKDWDANGRAEANR